MEKKMENNNLEVFSNAPVPQAVLKNVLPAMAAMIMVLIYNLADTFFVGRISTSASGAVGVVSSLMAIIQALGFMLGHGSGTIINHNLNNKNTKQLNNNSARQLALSG